MLSSSGFTNTSISSNVWGRLAHFSNLLPTDSAVKQQNTYMRDPLYLVLHSRDPRKLPCQPRKRSFYPLLHPIEYCVLQNWYHQACISIIFCLSEQTLCFQPQQKSHRKGVFHQTQVDSDRMACLLAQQSTKYGMGHGHNQPNLPIPSLSKGLLPR